MSVTKGKRSMQMKVDEISQSIRKEMNRRRRYGGAEDVPAFLWELTVVREVMQATVHSAQVEGFDGDWERAGLCLEEKMEALAKTLRQKSVQNSAVQTALSETQRGGYHSLLASQHRGQSQAETEDFEGSRYFPYFPSTVRQDIGGHALAEYMSWHWQNHGWSTHVCNQICGGKYLTRDEAWEFLTSGLPKVLGYKDYEQLGLCPARTEGRILSKYMTLDGLLFMTNMLMVDPETRQPTATTDTLFSKVGNYCVEIHLPQGDTNRHLKKRLVLNLSEDRYHYITSRETVPNSYHVEYGYGRDWYIAPHPAPYFQGQSRYVEGYSTSVMADLIGMAEMLSGQYLVSIWDMLEACLTGCFPPQPSLTIFPGQRKISTDDGPDELPTGKKHTVEYAQGPATLTVQPWVTPETVAEAWREFRKTNPTYSPSEKQGDTLHFVLSHTLPGQEFEWDKLAKRWEEERGERMVRGQLYKQFQRAREVVLPGYSES